MIVIRAVLLVVALGCFVAAAFGVPSRVALTPAGLAVYVLSLLL